jgi:retron-type reverse transcriptase
VETKLTRIAQIAKEKPKEKITSLAGLLSKESLTETHDGMSKKKASGVDQVTKEEYGRKLDENLEVLLDNMKRQVYKPQPVKRVYIPKVGSTKMRPLGIPVVSDKITQRAAARILEAIDETEFSAHSYGYRPHTGAQKAEQ